MKLTSDTTLPATLNVTSADAAAGHRFAEAVFAAGGVAAIYGVNDFITVTRASPASSGIRSSRQSSLHPRATCSDRSEPD